MLHPWILPLLIASCVVMSVCGCDTRKPAPPPPQRVDPGPQGGGLPPEKGEAWSPERIAKDPDGYCVYARELLASQLKSIREREAEAVEKQAELVARKADFDSNLDDVSNLLKRARRAYEKASDESQWPAKFSGRSFAESDLKKLIVSTARYVEARSRLKDQYSASLKKLDDRVAKLRQSVDQLKDQEERLGLEHERLKLAKDDIDDKDLSQLAFDIAGTMENLLQEDSDGIGLDELIKINREKQEEKDFLEGN